MGLYELKIQKTDPDTEICVHLRFLVPVCSGHPIDIKIHSHKSLGQHDHNDMTCTRFGLRAFQHGNLCISRVSAQFFLGHLIDTKIILNKLLGQHDHNDLTCNRFGLQAFRHRNSCISKVSTRFFSRSPIDTKIILNESLDQHD